MPLSANSDAPPPVPQYLKAIWNVINFDEAEKRYNEALSGSKL